MVALSTISTRHLRGQFTIHWRFRRWLGLLGVRPRNLGFYGRPGDLIAIRIKQLSILLECVIGIAVDLPIRPAEVDFAAHAISLPSDFVPSSRPIELVASWPISAP